MKRYLLFGGEVYGLGGWQDFKGDHDDVVGALRAAVGLPWWQVVDSATGRVSHFSAIPEALLLDAGSIIEKLLDHRIVRTQAVIAIANLARKHAYDFSEVASRNAELRAEVDRLKILLADAKGGRS